MPALVPFKPLPPRIMVADGWPDGFCPLHTFDELPCRPWCLPVRMEFAQIADDMERLWRVEYGHDSGTPRRYAFVAEVLLA